MNETFSRMFLFKVLLQFEHNVIYIYINTVTGKWIFLDNNFPISRIIPFPYPYINFIGYTS